MHTVNPTPASPIDLDARAWLYVLAASGHEDLLKVGLTRNPLARWSAFHPRWYEAFDLRHSLLVGCETRADAQRLETALHQALDAHRCPMPMTLRLAAGGSTEWYRGAYAQARRFVDDCAAQGHSVQMDAATFLSARMAMEAQQLDTLLREAHAGLLDGWLSPAQCAALVDRVDGHCQFDPGLQMRLPQPAWQELLRAHRLLRRGTLG